jgi:hypothetical protein
MMVVEVEVHAAAVMAAFCLHCSSISPFHHNILRNPLTQPAKKHAHALQSRRRASFGFSDLATSSLTILVKPVLSP